jgi:hypothetical protein
LSKNQVGVDQPSSENEYLGQEVQDDAVFLPGKAHHAPSTGSDHVNDHIERMNVQGMQTDRGQNRKSTEIFEISHQLCLKDRERKPSSRSVYFHEDNLRFDCSVSRNVIRIEHVGPQTLTFFFTPVIARAQPVAIHCEPGEEE